ncbi:MAG: hypothetical protein NZ918_02830 [Aigarchaeota archaeon]|nr:hypothetical protein [Aigarchaeota archaeon]MDW8021671.1 hypothetical protein [Nitrososphaerota archaeon]
MVKIEVRTTLERFRRFVILNTCYSFIPRGYLHDPSIFPEREGSLGRIYVEALSKLDLETIQDIKFVKAFEVLGIIYNSKSGNTNLIWRQVKGNIGKISGEASPNSIVNLIETGALPRSYVKKALAEFAQRTGGSAENSTEP